MYEERAKAQLHAILLRVGLAQLNRLPHVFGASLALLVTWPLEALTVRVGQLLQKSAVNSHVGLGARHHRYSVVLFGERIRVIRHVDTEARCGAERRAALVRRANVHFHVQSVVDAELVHFDYVPVRLVQVLARVEFVALLKLAY